MLSNDKYYDNIPNLYKNLYDNRLLYIRSVNNLIYKFIKLKPQKYILDIGVGDGYRANSLISELKIDKINYYGLEPSKNMYENAKKYLLHKNLYHSNLENFRPNIKFDCVWFLWNVIGHVSDIDIFFIKLSKLLKKNGYIIFDYNNIFNIREYGLINFIKNKILSAFTQIFKFKITKLTHTTEVKFYTISFLKKTLQKCNFEIEKVYYVNYENGNIEDNSHNGQVMMICKYVPK